jgi:hypothetical protein
MRAQNARNASTDELERPLPGSLVDRKELVEASGRTLPHIIEHPFDDLGYAVEGNVSLQETLDRTFVGRVHHAG